MEQLTRLQKDLKEIILTYEEKTSGRIDNKNQIKQFNQLVRNEDISDELINFIIDSTDEINTRHFEFVEHTTKAIKDISEITHVDIEKLKHVMHKMPRNHEEAPVVAPVVPIKKPKWFDPRTWSISDAKFFIVATILMVCISLIYLNIDNVEFMQHVASMFNTTAKVK